MNTTRFKDNSIINFRTIFYMSRILAVGDLHGRQYSFEGADQDFTVLLGDIVDEFSFPENRKQFLKELNSCLNEVLFVPGNHG